MKKTGLLPLLALLGAVLGSGSAYARPGGCEPPHGAGSHRGGHDFAAHLDHMGDELGLSADQKSKLETLHKEKHKQKGERRQASRETHRAMHELMNAETVDEAAIRAKARELADEHADMMIEHAYFMRDFRAILTPEQREKLKALQEERAECMGKAFFRFAH